MLRLSLRESSLFLRHADRTRGPGALINRDGEGQAILVDTFSSDLQNRLEMEVFLGEMNIFAVFGTFKCPSRRKFLVVCTEAERVATVPLLVGRSVGNEGLILRALRVELVPYVSPDENEAKLVASVERLLSSGTFYFSELGDEVGKRGMLTRCQERAKGQGDQLDESDFIWNSQLIDDMGSSSVAARMVSPMMQGFAKTRSFDEDGIKHSITVISRRSVKQAGTRYNARGIDDNGNVAIFAETECIVTSSDDEIFSFVQVRGSVPVFWSQSNSSASVELTRNSDMTKPAFGRHLSWLRERYEEVPVFVNLLSANKGGESLLPSALANQVRCESEDLDVIDFDFHRFVNSGQSLEESLTPLMDRLRPYIYHFKSFSPNSGLKQSGLFRVNCLDCLDRTNAVQMQIAWEALMLSNLNSLPKASRELKQLFTDVWIKNGDVISKAYSGTGSVLSRLVRTAGEGGSKNQIATLIEHSWRSANRFIAANWDDAERHRAIGHLLGRPQVPTDEDEKDKNDFNMSVWVGTWNLNGNRMEDARLFDSWLTESADLVIMNCQETIDLTTVNVLLASRGDEERNRAIDIQILKQLRRVDPQSTYVQVASESLVGLYISVFVRRALGEHIDRVNTCRFKAGFGGTTGNKGSVAVSFRVKKSIQVECVNVHLDSGEFRNEERMRQLEDVLNSASLLDVSKKKLHKAVFLCGDFNFRCDGVNPDLARELVRNDRCDKLRRLDPFLADSANVLKAAEFKEMPLLFPPTYKYDSLGHLSEKRTPSWCDRIFFRLSHNKAVFELSPETYLSVPYLTFSDHKPVFATFVLRSAVKEIVDERSLPNQAPSVSSDLLSAAAADSPILDLLS